VYPRVLVFVASGKLDVKRLVTHNFDFATNMPPDCVKIQINMPT
jgi:threonine dehydrogenase-like Zn-dependent dehydrogenase